MGPSIGRRRRRRRSWAGVKVVVVRAVQLNVKVLVRHVRVRGGHGHVQSAAHGLAASAQKVLDGAEAVVDPPEVVGEEVVAAATAAPHDHHAALVRVPREPLRLPRVALVARELGLQRRLNGAHGRGCGCGRIAVGRGRGGVRMDGTPQMQRRWSRKNPFPKDGNPTLIMDPSHFL
jgi:hypothetical protein